MLLLCFCCIVVGVVVVVVAVVVEGGVAVVDVGLVVGLANQPQSRGSYCSYQSLLPLLFLFILLIVCSTVY